MGCNPVRSFSFACTLVGVLTLGVSNRANAEGGQPASRGPSPLASATSPNKGGVDKGGPDSQRAREIEGKAHEALHAGRMSEAADLFGEAWKVYRDPTLICNQGPLLSRVGRYAAAAESLSLCIRTTLAAEAPAMKAKIARELEKVRAHLGTLTISTNLPGAEIVVDNKVVGTTPLDGEIFVEPGNHSVEARAAGYESDVKLVPAEKGSWFSLVMRMEPTVTRRVMMEPTPLPEQESNGPRASPGSVVDSASSVIPSANASSGAYSGMRSEPRNVGPIFFGIGVAMLGGGLATVTFLAASKNYADANELFSKIAQRGPEHECSAPTADPQCGKADSERNNAAVFTGVGVVSVVVGASGAAFVAYEIVTGSSATPSTAPRVAFSAGPNGGALTVTGSF